VTYMVNRFRVRLTLGYIVVLGYILSNLLNRFRLGYLIRLLIRLLLSK